MREINITHTNISLTANIHNREMKKQIENTTINTKTWWCSPMKAAGMDVRKSF